jgi:hypothetical protein
MTLAERYGLGYPVPLDPRCFVHLDAVTDSREALVGCPCVLLAIHRAGHFRYLVAVLKQLQHRGVGLGHHGGQGHGLAGKVLEAPRLIECSGVGDSRAISRGGSAWGSFSLRGGSTSSEVTCCCSSRTHTNRSSAPPWSGWQRTIKRLHMERSVGAGVSVLGTTLQALLAFALDRMIHRVVSSLGNHGSGLLPRIGVAVHSGQHASGQDLQGRAAGNVDRMVDPGSRAWSAQLAHHVFHAERASSGGLKVRTFPAPK